MITVRPALESAATPAWHTLDATELERVLDVDRGAGPQHRGGGATPRGAW